MKELKRYGLLLESDLDLPSLSAIVAVRPIRGSWWGHPQGEIVYQVANKIGDHPDVLVVKFVSGKVTYVHRRLWPAIYSVATAREPWQLKGLTPTAKSILNKVRKKGWLQTDHLPGYKSKSKIFAKSARLLERRLLVLGRDVHTPSGAHAKQLETWDRWASRVGLALVKMRAESAKRKLEQVLTNLAGECEARDLLPWNYA